MSMLIFTRKLLLRNDGNLELWVTAMTRQMHVNEPPSKIEEVMTWESGGEDITPAQKFTYKNHKSWHGWQQCQEDRQTIQNNLRDLYEN